MHKIHIKLPDLTFFAYLALTASALLMTTGCSTPFSPHQMGMSNTEWQSYDKLKQQGLLERHKQITLANKAEDKEAQEVALALKARDAAQIASAMSATSTASTTSSATSALPVAATPASAEQQLPTIKIIEVKISNGKAFMPPFTSNGWQVFAPATATIVADTCQNIWLTQLGSNDKVKVALRCCYKDKALHLDPSLYELDKQDGTMTIPYSPLWDRGFTYHGINSDGYAKLKNVAVTIKNVSSVSNND